MPAVKQTLSPEAANCLQSIFHRPRKAEAIPFEVIAEIMHARLGKTTNFDGVPHLCITPAGKTRVMKWSVNA